jgi:uncharacterized protein YbcI
MPDDPLQGAVGAAISNDVVRLHHKYGGRGPSQAQTYMTRDYIAVVLGDYLTTGAQTLVRQGRPDAVAIGRQVLHQAVSPEMIAAVEQHSGRRVLAHLTADHIDPDVSVESFILAPPTAGNDR